MRKFIWGLLIGMLLMGLWNEAHQKIDIVPYQSDSYVIGSQQWSVSSEGALYPIIDSRITFGETKYRRKHWWEGNKGYISRGDNNAGR